MSFVFKYKSHPQNKAKKLPLIPVKIHAKQDVETLGLIDSGADYSVLPLSMAEALGVPFKKSEAEDIAGIGGLHKAYPCRISVTITGKGEHNTERLELPAFAIQADRQEPFLLLGRLGFFDKFEITFKESEEKIILKKIEGNAYKLKSR